MAGAKLRDGDSGVGPYPQVVCRRRVPLHNDFRDEPVTPERFGMGEVWRGGGEAIGE